MTGEQAKASAAVPPGVYFEGGVWGAAGALVLVGLLEGWPVASSVGLAGVAFQTARLLRWLARVSPADAEPGDAPDRRGM
jgi:hypothetical protein